MTAETPESDGVETETAESDAVENTRSDDTGPTPDARYTSTDPDAAVLDQRLHNLHAATRELLRADDRAGVATVTANAVEDILGFELNSVRLYDSEMERLLPTAVSPEVVEISGEREAYERGESVQWTALDDREVLVFHDVREIEDDVSRTGEGSMLVAPLGDHGVLTLGSRDADGITRRDVELAQVLAANVEVAMDRAEWDERLRNRTTELTRQNERLEDFASILSHDLRNPLNTAQGRVTLAKQKIESDADDGENTEDGGDSSDGDDASSDSGGAGDTPDDLDAASDALDRMESLIDRVLEMTRSGARVEVDDPVAVGEVARAAWTTSPTETATIDVDTELVARADRERLRTLFENLFRNAIEHGGEDVSVVVGTLPDGDGFYVADDGPGVPEEVATQAFERGFTTTADGTGFGLAIVKEVVDAHEWSVDIGASPQATVPDGACFEIRTE
jgi:signal transduction histidine kinase